MTIRPLAILRSLAIVALAAAAIWFAFAYSVAGITRSGNPVLALKLNPGDARAMAALADRAIRPDATPADLDRAAKLARAALVEDPTVVAAARTLGLIKAIRGDAKAAERLLGYSSELSSRDLATRVWLIDRAVKREDVRGALHQYDIALRTSARSDYTLMPTLVKATADPRLTEDLAKLLATNPNWRPIFINQVISAAPNSQRLVELVVAMGAHKAPLSEEELTSLIDRLAQEKNYNLAWRVYGELADLRGRPRDADMQNGDFQREDRVAPFEWTYANASGLFAQRAPRAQGELALFYEIGSDAGGEVARQIVMVEPGTYILSGLSADISGESGPTMVAAPIWEVRCATGEMAELAQRRVPSSRDKPVPHSVRFTVPSGCPAISLALRVESSDDPGVRTGWVDKLRLRRL